MKLEVGKNYWNGFGAKITIVKAPSEKSRWYEDELETRYHETGEAVRCGSSRPEFNLSETD